MVLESTKHGLIDLSHPLEPATPPWPGNPAVEIVVVSSIPSQRGPLDRSAPGEPIACNTTAFLTCNHTGTHMDSPAHFYNGVRTIEQVPLEQCIGPAVLVDVRHILPAPRSRRRISSGTKKPSGPPARSYSGPVGPAAGARTTISMTIRS